MNDHRSLFFFFVTFSSFFFASIKKTAVQNAIDSNFLHHRIIFFYSCSSTRFITLTISSVDISKWLNRSSSINMKSQSSLSTCWKFTNDSFSSFFFYMTIANRWECRPSQKCSSTTKKKMFVSVSSLTSILIDKFSFASLSLFNANQMKQNDDNGEQQTVKKSKTMMN